MVLTILKQITESDLQALRQQATVSVSGYFYSVNLGPEVRPQHHYVGKDRRCTCRLGADCPAVLTVVGYLRAGGERAPDVPFGYFPVSPQVYLISGAEMYYVPDLSSKRCGAGWACVKGSEAHYWLAHVNVLRKTLVGNPWIYPPVFAADGQVVYPGLKRDDIITESRPWPDGNKTCYYVRQTTGRLQKVPFDVRVFFSKRHPGRNPRRTS
jgi:hypothetical protein